MRARVCSSFIQCRPGMVFALSCISSQGLINWRSSDMRGEYSFMTLRTVSWLASSTVVGRQVESVGVTELTVAPDSTAVVSYKTTLQRCRLASLCSSTDSGICWSRSSGDRLQDDWRFGVFNLIVSLGPLGVGRNPLWLG